MRRNTLFKGIAVLSAISMLVTGVGTWTPKKVEAAKTVDLNGTYHAALGIQTSTDLWLQRWGYYGKDMNEMFGTSHVDQLYYKDTKTSKFVYGTGTFTDATIAGNGNYTVSLDGADFLKEKKISQLHVATDIPKSSAITFSNVTVTVDGKQVLKFDTGFMENEAAYTSYGMIILALNHWRDKLVTKVKEMGLAEDKDDAGCYTLLTGTAPESVSISFDVAGFNYNKGDAPAATTAPEATPAPGTTPSDTSALIAPTKGSVETVSGVQYLVTGDSTVAVKKGSASASSANIPAQVTIKGLTFDVTSIASSAFAKNKKLKKVLIGKNVTTIGAKAFYQCKNLKKIDLKTSGNKVLKKVGKQALKGVNKKCVISVSSSSKKALTKVFKGKGQAKSVKVK